MPPFCHRNPEPDPSGYEAPPNTWPALLIDGAMAVCPPKAAELDPDVVPARSGCEPVGLKGVNRGGEGLLPDDRCEGPPRPRGTLRVGGSSCWAHGPGVGAHRPVYGRPGDVIAKPIHDLHLDGIGERLSREALEARLGSGRVHRGWGIGCGGGAEAGHQRVAGLSIQSSSLDSLRVASHRAQGPTFPCLAQAVGLGGADEYRSRRRRSRGNSRLVN